jgi:hypothetical protein
MVVTQSTSPSDHIPERQKRKIRRVHHIVTKTRAREWLLSKLMRPAELVQAFRAAVVLVAVKLLVAFRGLQSGTTSP